VSEQRRSERVVASVIAGAAIGVVEMVLAISFAALVFGGYVVQFLADGIGLYLGAAALTLAIFAWRAGARGVVGSVQDATAAVLAVVATTTAVATFGGPEPSFLTVVAATMVVTVLTGITLFVLGRLRLGNLVRFVPYPVVGGFLAGTGWLLMKGGIAVAAREPPFLVAIGDLLPKDALVRWVPAVLFGVLLLTAVRVVKRPLVIPAVLGIGLVAFAVGVVVTGSSLQEARSLGWLVLGPFDTGQVWQPWAARAITGADWVAVLRQAAGILAAVFVAVIGVSFNVNATEIVLHRDLDTNRELRDAGVLNIVSGAFGGIPGYHALSLTALTERMSVNARTAGLVAALVPLAAVVFGASVIELIPRLLVGGVLVFLGLAFIVEWVWDKRKTLPRVEYAVVLVILAGIIGKGFLPGVVIGLVMAIVLFAFNYGRIELVREVAFGDTYRSNVDRPTAERAALRTMGEQVQVLRINGFVFFGSANGLLERIRKRVQAAPLRFLVMDLRRVSGMDSSAVMSFVKVVHVAEANGFELVFTDVSERVQAELERGGVVASEGVVRFEPDLDRGLQQCEEGLLETAAGDGDRIEAQDASGEGLAEMPLGLSSYLERESLPEGTVLIRQNEPRADVFVLESGRLSVETVTTAGTRMRLATIRPGVVVGEVAMFSGVPRMADVVAEAPSVVLRLRRSAIERMESEEPELAAALHRWLARTLADRLSDTLREFDALLD
jgi:SulP family sulfate permease